jgi:hypothetical protein
MYVYLAFERNSIYLSEHTAGDVCVRAPARAFVCVCPFGRVGESITHYGADHARVKDTLVSTG